MHHDGVLGKLPQPGGVQPVAAAVLAHAGEVGGVHPLLLDPQHHHHVALGQRRVQVVAHRARPAVDRHGQQGGRRDQRDLRPEQVQQPDVGPGDPAVQHVAHDRDPQPVQRLAAAPAEPAPDGERVQQRLGRVLVGAVAGVDHAAPHPARQPVRRARGAVPDDHRVGTHGLQRERGVLEALPLGHARALDREVDHIGGQPLGRGLEGDPGPGGVLEEQVHDRAPAQGGQLLDGPVRHPGQFLGGVQDQQRVLLAQVGG